MTITEVALDEWIDPDPPPSFPLSTLLMQIGCDSQREWIRRAPFSFDRARRLWVSGMLSAFEADAAAIKVGLHPAIIWPDWFGAL